MRWRRCSAGMTGRRSGRRIPMALMGGRLMRALICGLLFIFTTVAFAGGVNIRQDIDTVVKQGRGTPDGRAAWDRLSAAKADVLPALLEGMNTKDTVAANWLRLAFDSVAARDSKGIDSA